MFDIKNTVAVLSLVGVSIYGTTLLNEHRFDQKFQDFEKKINLEHAKKLDTVHQEVKILGEGLQITHDNILVETSNR